MFSFHHSNNWTRSIICGVGICFTCTFNCIAQASLNSPVKNISTHISTIIPFELSCKGEEKELTISSHMPYVLAKVGDSEGYFLVDFGTGPSKIDPAGFPNIQPKPELNTPNRFSNFDFFGSWGTVTLPIQDYSSIKGTIRQAGIIGTDLLCLNAYLLDYQNNKLHRYNQGSICTDQEFKHYGFKAATTKGYYSTKESSELEHPNIPTIPVSIGKATAVAQIDPGFDDNQVRHSVNINRAFYDLLVASNVALIERSEIAPGLSTCVPDVTELPIKSFKLGKGVSFNIIAVNGSVITSAPDAVLFLKESPAAAKSCGGIGTWTTPGAQFGASFLLDAGIVFFDPFSSRVWFGSIAQHQLQNSPTTHSMTRQPTTSNSRKPKLRVNKNKAKTTIQ